MECLNKYNSIFSRIGNREKAFFSLDYDCQVVLGGMDRYFYKMLHTKLYTIYEKQVRKYTELNAIKVVGIEKRNFYKYHLDHIVPISLGFKLNILPVYIGSEDNLQLLTPYENFYVKSNKITAKGQVLLDIWGIKY